MASYNWTRDELILALDLYFKEPSARGSKTHPAVQELSALLNTLPIHPKGDREGYFRNPNGVGMKLSNFLRFDPEYSGVGLRRGGRLEKEVWLQFAEDREGLSQLAQAIRTAARSSELASTSPDEADEVEANEGRILTRMHKVRERNASLVSRKKRTVLETTGRLECQVCGFDFNRKYGARGEGFAECHHTVPLTELGVHQRTRISDLVIVCANCHRMIHRSRPWLSISELQEMIEV